LIMDSQTGTHQLLPSHHPKTTIDYAEWPRDAPSVMERNIITIICGNTRLHWALHEGCMNKFMPIMFWFTIHDHCKDGSAWDLDETDPCDLLEAHIANQAHTLIFGEGNKKGCAKSASNTAAKRDAPGISVFVVSSNPTMERKICHMFRDVPAKLFKLRNTDFFSTEEGVYPTMGVDRVAALYGAKLHYGAPTLVIDGGTAMTYTMLDEKSQIIGGGISPGVKVRLQSLADYTGSLPTIDHLKFKTAVEGAIASKTPLPFFAKDTEMAMISPVCAELSCQLRNIIKQYVAKCQSSSVEASSSSLPSSSSSTRVSPQGEGTAEKASATSIKTKRYPVIITGGDGKFLKDLLQANASKIINVEPDATPIQAHAIDIRNVRNLVTYALGDVIYEKFSKKPRNDPEEKLRLKIQGLRIAALAIDQKEIFSRGCVFNITPESMIEGYVFHARLDNGTQKDLTLRELHDCLVLYNEIGEKPGPEGSTVLGVDEDWITEKKMWSKKVQEELGNVSRLIRNRIRQLKPHIEKGEIAEIFKKRSSIESRMNHETNCSKKKAKRSSSVAASNNLRTLLGKRIAKRFPIDNGDLTVNAGDQIFFGTVKYISDNLLHWYFVSYDDGDSEEIGINDVVEGIDLYEVHKCNDPMHQYDVENQQKPACTLPFGSKPTGVLFHSNNTEDNLESITTYTDLSTLLDLSASSDGCNAQGGTSTENERRISEFKEEI